MEDRDDNQAALLTTLVWAMPAWPDKGWGVFGLLDLLHGTVDELDGGDLALTGRVKHDTKNKIRKHLKLKIIYISYF